MSEMDDLRTCPFCFVGTLAVTEETTEFDTGYAITCHHCHARGPIKIEKDMAMAAWNSAYREEDFKKQHTHDRFGVPYEFGDK